MSGFKQVIARPVHLPLENVDTDQLIPARFMSRPRSEGYGDFLFYDLRKQDPRAQLGTGSKILISGRNFGCGSSREAAVYALMDFGIRAVLAPSFGDIFAANAVNNGLLPARATETELAQLSGEITVDLQTAEIVCDGIRIAFGIDPVWQTKLLNGWDDIDLTRQHEPTIAAFKARRQKDEPWSIPV